MAQQSTSPTTASARPQRVYSVDAYRGLVMLAIASSGLGIGRVVQNMRDNGLWQSETHQHIWEVVEHQFEHATWVGCTAWDLIQPSFMFLVGVSLAFSYAKRRAQGQSYRQMLRHAITRSAILVGLAILLSSNWGDRMTNFTFVNVLAQIGLSYTFLFLLWGRKSYELFVTAIAILVGYWAIFATFPTPEPGFDYAAVGIPNDWPSLPGFEAHWDKNTNAAAAVDRWLLNLFPREKEFVYNEGGYQTLNFAASLATMIFGLMVGELLRSNRSKGGKFFFILLGGLGGLAVGQALAHWFDLLKYIGLGEMASVQGVAEAGVCPLVKRIWSPSWAIFSAGWACTLTAAFYLILDVVRFRWWAYPLVVVGANPIVMYMMSQLLKPWTRRTLEIHWRGFSELIELWTGLLGRWTEGAAVQIHCIDLPESYTELLPTQYAHFAPMVEAIAVVLVFWLICFFLYRQRAFIRI